MSEYSYQVPKSKKQMSEFSYWVQKSKTCDLNFHIGCKRASLRNLSTDRVDFALEEVKKQD
jgi:hypothetical protein